MERSAMDDQFLDVNGAGFHDGIILPSVEPSNLDFQFLEFPGSAEDFQFDEGVVSTSLEQASDPYSFAPFYNVTSEVDFSDDNGSYPMLNYINQILMEEEQLEEQPSMYHDPLALQAAEDSFYQILGKNYPPPSEPPLALDRNAQSPDGSTQSSSHRGTGNSSVDSSASGDPISVLDADKLSGKDYQPVDNRFMSPFQANSFTSLQPLKSSSIIGDGEISSSFANGDLISSFLSETETILLFKKGLEEGNKFLPTGSQLSIDLDKYKSPSKLENMELVSSGKNDKEELPTNRLRRKYELQNNDESDLGRSSKQSAVNGEEGELAEIFDALVLCANRPIPRSEADARQSAESCKILGQIEVPNYSDAVKGSEKRQGTDDDTIDISATLISCAQIVATGDQRAANEQLKLIRQHASCTGTPHQRLAVIFANALEARLTGTGPDRYVALTSRQNSAAEDLKFHRIFLCAAPFRQMVSFFANKMILKAVSKATTLHIVDFGISHGFQWPNLIQQLSERPGSPPKLRITGIDLPQPGFRPAERIEQAGRRLAKYCQKLNIPFQFQAIASKDWDKIKIEELKLARNEVLAVNTHFHLKNLLDETVDDDCPRDAVLRLIRNMNPDIYVSATLNAPVSAAFFLTRFRDAFLFYSTIFDVLDNNLPREDRQRMKFEQECFGPEVMNVIACEGKARIERPETYKQWQIRYNRAGFRLLPLNQDLLKELKGKVKEGYHKDFMLDGNGYWMHMGWKGKIIASSSCWVPA